MDFVSFPGARDAERNGRKRENQAQNRLSGAVGEVRKFPHEPAITRGDTRDRARKNPNSDELGFCIWWSSFANETTPLFQRMSTGCRCLCTHC